MVPKKPTLHPDRSFLTLGEPGRDAAPIESRAQVSCEELEQFCSQRVDKGISGAACAPHIPNNLSPAAGHMPRPPGTRRKQKGSANTYLEECVRID